MRFLILLCVILCFISCLCLFSFLHTLGKKWRLYPTHDNPYPTMTTYDAHIDVDEASTEWRKNKIPRKNGYFQYKCSVSTCANPIYRHTTENKGFRIFATDFDLLHQHHPNKYHRCEEHLLTEWLPFWLIDAGLLFVCLFNCSFLFSSHCHGLSE